MLWASVLFFLNFIWLLCCSHFHLPPNLAVSLHSVAVPSLKDSSSISVKRSWGTCSRSSSSVPKMNCTLWDGVSKQRVEQKAKVIITITIKLKKLNKLSGNAGKTEVSKIKYKLRAFWLVAQCKQLFLLHKKIAQGRCLILKCLFQL